MGERQGGLLNALLAHPVDDQAAGHRELGLATLALHVRAAFAGPREETRSRKRPGRKAPLQTVGHGN